MTTFSKMRGENINIIIWISFIVLLVSFSQAAYTDNPYGSGCYGVESCPSSGSGGSGGSQGSSGSGSGGGGTQIFKQYNTSKINNIQNTTKEIKKIVIEEKPTPSPISKNDTYPSKPLFNDSKKINYEEPSEIVQRGFLNTFPWWLIVITLLIILYILFKREKEHSQS